MLTAENVLRSNSTTPVPPVRRVNSSKSFVSAPAGTPVSWKRPWPVDSRMPVGVTMGIVWTTISKSFAWTTGLPPLAMTNVSSVTPGAGRYFWIAVPVTSPLST